MTTESSSTETGTETKRTAAGLPWTTDVAGYREMSSEQRLTYLGLARGQRVEFRNRQFCGVNRPEFLVGEVWHAKSVGLIVWVDGYGDRSINHYDIVRVLPAEVR